MKKSNPNSGITLVALVITIIILLILAGITINLTVGQQGILRRAQEAGKNYQESANKEKSELDNLLNEVDDIIKDMGIKFPEVYVALKGDTLSFFNNESEMKHYVEEEGKSYGKIEKIYTCNEAGIPNIPWFEDRNSITTVNIAKK